MDMWREKGLKSVKRLNRVAVLAMDVTSPARVMPVFKLPSHTQWKLTCGEAGVV